MQAETRVRIDKSLDAAGIESCRVYSVTVEGERREQMLDELYPTFLASLCTEDLTLFIEHADSQMNTELASALREAGAAFDEATFYPRELRSPKSRVRVRGRPWFEITLTTSSRRSLEILFRKGDMYSDFRRWILDSPTLQFPVETLRLLNLGGERALSVFEKAVRTHVALLETREFHGPWVWTISLDERVVLEAARSASDRLGVPLKSSF